MRKRKFLIIVPVLGILFPGACEKEEAEPATQITIPCNVGIVVEAGEGVGNRGNDGCRLTVDEVTSYMEELNRKAQFYGANVTFTYNTPFVWGNLNWDARPEAF